MVSTPLNVETSGPPLLTELRSINRGPCSGGYRCLRKIAFHSMAFGVVCLLVIPGQTQKGALAFTPDRTAQSVRTPPRSSDRQKSISSQQAYSLSNHIQSNFHQPISQKDIITISTCLHMTKIPSDEESNPKKKNNGKKPRKKKLVESVTNSTSMTSRAEREIFKRISQLEQLVAKQEVEISHLRKECKDLAQAAESFARIVELLRDAGLDAENIDPVEGEADTKSSYKQPKQESVEEKEKTSEVPGDGVKYEYFDDSEIFGSAPSSVIDAADAAGASILAALLAGKQRMLVDVRDAELSRDAETLVQFIELAVLPVAAGLEGLNSARNRVKIVFPTVSQLLTYRRTMALAAPDVVALSTLGFDPVEKRDNLVVIIAPSPDDEEGLAAMNELLQPTNSTAKPILRQPTVVLNHHMVPVSGPAASYEVAYHLRLLSVQFMTGENAPEYYEKWEGQLKELARKTLKDRAQVPPEVLDGPPPDKGEGEIPEEATTEGEVPIGEDGAPQEEVEIPQEEDAALEAAMQHAHELGVFNQGVTRAMVIRAYPKPWHIFVDTSPDTDADFEVAATFDEEPTQDDVNFAIVECLEGSEREDELVAQQMQQALEAGQLDKVSEMLELSPDFSVEGDNITESLSDEKKGDDGDDWYNDFEEWEEDSC